MTSGKNKHTWSRADLATQCVMSDKSASDNCRLCGFSFKIQFGNLPKKSHSSSENIFKPSKRKECFVVVLSEIFLQVGFSLVQDSSRFSDSVCNPCGRKIRNLGQLYHFVKNATATKSTSVKTSKRNLDTPDKASPPWRKSKSQLSNWQDSIEGSSSSHAIEEFSRL